MRVRSYGAVHEKRIGVTFGSGEHDLDIGEAAALRDALTREIGEKTTPPFAVREADPLFLPMTDREAMVWAAAFVHVLASIQEQTDECTRAQAAKLASLAVYELRQVNQLRLDFQDRAMLFAMTGGAR